MIIKELTIELLRSLLPHLDERHRAEILRTHKDLDVWAIERCALPGISWALFDGEEIVLVGGVVSNGARGTVWIAGRQGWARYVLHPVRIFRDLFSAKVYAELECQCFEDNEPAQRFAEYLGFKRRDVRDGLVHYARTA